MSVAAAIVLGILIGWLIEWVIDFFYWRGRYAELQNKIVSLQNQPVETTRLNAELESQSGDSSRLIAELEKLRQDYRSLARQLELVSGEKQDLIQKLDAIPVVPDDLKVIKGIGPEIERRLHAAGITSFALLAELTPADLERILGDVIKRLSNEESLLDQARELAGKAK